MKGVHHHSNIKESILFVSSVKEKVNSKGDNDKMKVVGLKIKEEWYEALNKYCELKGTSKQQWLYSKLEDHFFILEKLTPSLQASEVKEE